MEWSVHVEERQRVRPKAKLVAAMSDLEHMVEKARYAANGGFDVLSTGEKLAAAMILNRADWLAEMGYTISEAIGRVEPEWLALIPSAAKVLAETSAVLRKADMAAKDEAILAALGAHEVDVSATLVTYGSAPGYRTAMFTFDVQRIGRDGGPVRRLSLHVNAKDSEDMVRHLIEVHQWAWKRGAPLDVRQGESRPLWLSDIQS